MEDETSRRVIVNPGEDRDVVYGQEYFDWPGLRSGDVRDLTRE